MDRDYRFINPYLREEISLKKKKIEKDPKFFDKENRLIVEEVRSLGDLFSFWIENPSLRKALLLENRKPKTIKKLSRKGIKNIQNSWYFLKQKGIDGEFIDYFNPFILKRANGLVLGEKKSQFRKKDVTLNHPDYTPPSFQKVERLVEEAIFDIKEIYKEDPLEAAISAHLKFAAIQPFMEGNKRTARLIQDRILYEANFPPAIISAGEAKYYLNLFCQTLPFYESKNKEGQKEFYNYCASKVNNNLDLMLDDL